MSKNEQAPSKSASKRKREEKDDPHINNLPAWVHWTKLFWDTFSDAKRHGDWLLISERHLNDRTRELPQEWPECTKGIVPRISSCSGEISMWRPDDPWEEDGFEGPWTTDSIELNLDGKVTRLKKESDEEWVWDLMDDKKIQLQMNEQRFYADPDTDEHRWYCSVKFNSWAIPLVDMIAFCLWSHDHHQDYVDALQKEQRALCKMFLNTERFT